MTIKWVNWLGHLLMFPSVCCAGAGAAVGSLTVAAVGVVLMLFGVVSYAALRWWYLHSWLVANVYLMYRESPKATAEGLKALEGSMTRLTRQIYERGGSM